MVFASYFTKDAEPHLQIMSTTIETPVAIGARLEELDEIRSSLVANAIALSPVVGSRHAIF